MCWGYADLRALPLYETHRRMELEGRYDVGMSMAKDTRAMAEQNQEVRFVILAFTYDTAIPNVLGVTFANDKSAFMAGYLAAGMTKSGTVGTFGGMEFPPVVAYMVGFEGGVNHYNERHGTDVEVLGADRFIGSFDSTEDARRSAEEWIAEDGRSFWLVFTDFQMITEKRPYYC